MCALEFASLKALKALKAHTFKSKLVAECLGVLNRLILKCTVTLRWVPGHTSVEGNEITDQLAEPFFGYNNTKCNQILDEWILRRNK
jgi:ribonuclease HI